MTDTNDVAANIIKTLKIDLHSNGVALGGRATAFNDAAFSKAERAIRDEIEGWRLIETAPRDGTIIQVKRGDWVGERICWHVNAWCERLNSRFENLGFIALNDDHQPTHWMPIDG